MKFVVEKDTNRQIGVGRQKVQFTNGVFETDDEYLCTALKAHCEAAPYDMKCDGGKVKEDDEVIVDDEDNEEDKPKKDSKKK